VKWNTTCIIYAGDKLEQFEDAFQRWEEDDEGIKEWYGRWRHVRVKWRWWNSWMNTLKWSRKKLSANWSIYAEQCTSLTFNNDYWLRWQLRYTTHDCYTFITADGTWDCHHCCNCLYSFSAHFTAIISVVVTTSNISWVSLGSLHPTLSTITMVLSYPGRGNIINSHFEISC